MMLHSYTLASSSFMADGGWQVRGGLSPLKVLTRRGQEAAHR